VAAGSSLCVKLPTFIKSIRIETMSILRLEARFSLASRLAGGSERLESDDL
jgi:hypothetical protein